MTPCTGSAELEKVRFNNKSYDSWEEALLALRPDGHHCSAPALSSEHMNAARALVLRVGGATAASQSARMITQGYPTAMQPLGAGVAGNRLKAQFCRRQRASAIV